MSNGNAMLGRTMPPSTTIRLRVSDEILEAIRKHCESTGIEQSELIRLAVLQHIGREDLNETMRSRGRPGPKTEEPPPLK